jgi:hypothetical protein
MPGGTEKRIRAQIEELNLKPYAHVLDNTGTICAAFGVSWKAPLTIVIVDGSGKMTTKGLDACLPSAKGILSDLKVPAGAEQAAHMYSLQQFDLMEQEFAKVAPSPDVKAFREALKKKTDDYTARRVPELVAMSSTDPLAAFHETNAFLKAFRSAKEAGAASSLASKLASNPVVKKELDAEAMYQQLVAPEVVKATTAAVYDKKVKPLMDGYAQRFAGSKFAEAMKTVNDAYRASLR